MNNTSSTKPQLKDACEWLRVSTPNQVYAGGLETAKAITLQIAERVGLLVKWAIELPGISGTRVMLTKQIAELIRIITREDCKDVILKECSRLMRADRFGDYRILDVFRDHGVTLHTPTRSWNLANPDDRMMFVVEMGIASKERETLLKRTNDTREFIRQSGRHASGSGCLPFGIGYDRHNEAFFPNKDADVVREVFRLFTSGVTSFRKIAQMTGVSYYKIGDLLANTAYVGRRTYTERVMADGKGNVYHDDDTLKYQKKVRRAEPLIVDMVGFKKPGKDGKIHPTVVTQDVFDHAQQLLKAKRGDDARGAEREDDPFLFRGFLRCECGAKMICYTRQSGEYYCCKRAYGDIKIARDGTSKWRIKNRSCRTYRVRRERIEPKLNLLVTEKLANPKFILSLLENQRAEQDTEALRRRGSAMAAQIEDTQRKLKRMRVAWEDGDYDDDRVEYKRRKELLETQLDEQKKALNECVPAIPEISVEYLSKLLATLSDWRMLPRTDRRSILRAVCPEIKVRVTGNGVQGRGSDTLAMPLGLYLNLGMDDADAAPKGEWTTRESIGEWTASEESSRTLPTDVSLVYLPLTN